MEQKHLTEEESLAGTEVQNTLLSGQDTAHEAAPESASTAAVSSNASELKTLLKQEACSRLQKPWAILSVEATTVLSLMFWVRWTTGRSDEGLSGPENSIWMILMLCFGLLGAVSWGAYAILGYRAYRRKRAFAKTLSEPQDREQLGLLLQVLGLPDPVSRNLAKQQLITLLPTLRAEDEDLLREADRKILLRLLATTPQVSDTGVTHEFFSEEAYRFEVDLRVAILKAFEYVGGAQEVETIERLSRSVPILFHSSLAVTHNYPPEIREAAEACLPFVQRHAAEQRASTQLLRASSPPASPSDVLLRPATGLPDTPPEQLLRAGEPPA